MYTKTFNSTGVDLIKISFICDECNHPFESNKLGIFKQIFIPNNETYISPSIVSSHRCNKCDKEFIVNILNNQSQTSINIENLNENSEVILTDFTLEEQIIEDQIDTFLYDTDRMKIFRREIDKLRQLLNIPIENTDIGKTLLKQIYTSSITCMEDYLSTTLIQEVLNDKEAFKKFVIEDKELSKRSFNLSQIFDTYEKLEKLVKERLLSIQFHNIAFVRSLYKIVFNYKFPEIAEIAKIVNNRHDYVHRNGRDKEGNEVVIDRKTVSEAINTVEKFIEDIDGFVSLL